MTDPTAHAENLRRSLRLLWQDVFGLAFLATGSLCIGLLVNSLRSHRLPLTYASPTERLEEEVARMSAGSPLDHPQEAAPAPWHFIELDELQERVAAHHGRCIDARAPAFYQAGHIPGALNVPRESFERGYAKIRPLLESAKETPVIVYCSDADCPDGELVAGGLSHLGYRQLFVYKEGWEEWMRAGLPRDVGQGL